MQLKLKGSGSGETVRLESTLDGFDEIAERVAEVARSKGIGMTDTTISNFAALGIDADLDSTPVTGRGEDAGSWTARGSR